MSDIKLLIKITYSNIGLKEVCRSSSLLNNEANDDDRNKIDYNPEISTYSAQTTTEYNIYSLLKYFRDSQGRDGYYEIGIYCFKHKKVIQPVELLSNLNDKYLNHFGSNISEDLFYAILESYATIDITPSVTVDKNKYYLFASNIEEVSRVFNNEKIFSLNKTFIYNPKIKVDQAGQGLLDFNKEIQKIRQIHIVNNRRILSELKIEDKILRSSQINFLNFNLYFKQGESIKYKTIDNSDYRIISSLGTTFTISAIDTVPGSNGTTRKKESFYDKYGVLILLFSILSISISGGLYFFWPQKPQEETTTTIEETNQPQTTPTQATPQPTSEVSFFKEGTNSKTNSKIFYYLNNGKQTDTIVYISNKICLVNLDYSNDKDCQHSLKLSERNIFKNVFKDGENKEKEILDEIKEKCGCILEKKTVVSPGPSNKPKIPPPPKEPENPKDKKKKGENENDKNGK